MAMPRNTTPLSISVILPVYMREPSALALRQLGEAIDSVTDQAYPGEVELLLVDNGPTRIAAVLEELPVRPFPGLRIIRTTRSNGLVHALNTGLREARHDWIARIDADDSWCPGKIELQAARVDEDEDLTIVGTGMTLKHENGQPDEEHIRADGWTRIMRFFVDVGSPFPHGSVLARKSIYRLLGGYSHDVRTAHCEDFALWGTWLRFFKPAMIEQLLYRYTVSPSQVSAVHAAQQKAASAYVVNEFGRLGLVDRLPRLMQSLAGTLGISLVQAGVLCYRLWHYRPPCACVPESAVSVISGILVDRTVEIVPARPGLTPLSIADLLRSFEPMPHCLSARSVGVMIAVR